MTLFKNFIDNYAFMFEGIKILDDTSFFKEYSPGKYEFEFDGEIYKFYQDGYTNVSGINFIDLEFSRVTSNGKNTLDKLNSKEEKVSFFSKVATCLHSFLIKYNPESFRFVARDAKLARIYELMNSKLFKFGGKPFTNYYKFSIEKYGDKYFYYSQNEQKLLNLEKKEIQLDEKYRKLFNLSEAYMNSSRYNVTLNWKGELHRYEEIEAASDKHAVSKCIGALAKKLGKIDSAVRREVKGDKIKVDKVG